MIIKDGKKAVVQFCRVDSPEYAKDVNPPEEIKNIILSRMDGYGISVIRYYIPLEDVWYQYSWEWVPLTFEEQVGYFVRDINSATTAENRTNKMMEMMDWLFKYYELEN